MNGLVITAHPTSAQADPYLVLNHANTFTKLSLENGKTIKIHVDKSTKYCVGWYDIESHTNYLCESRAIVDAKYDSCFACRKKTAFNPAFYNTSDISNKQAKYNNAAHSVYVAYFGNGLAKAGIMSDSRGLERIYEQGALLYAIVDTCPNATIAHNTESRLIQKGFKNSVTKKQKSDALSKVFNVTYERQLFQNLLKSISYSHSNIISNIDTFFFGKYPKAPIQRLSGDTISGVVKGVVGRYLILENNGILYGYWLNDLFGYKASFKNQLDLIDKKPQQMSLI